VLREEQICCEPGCGRPSQHADHIESIAKRPDLKLSRANLRGICASHHAAKTCRFDFGFGNGRRDDFNPDSCE